jgi:hypothetical protein
MYCSRSKDSSKGNEEWPFVDSSEADMLYIDSKRGKGCNNRLDRSEEVGAASTAPLALLRRGCGRRETRYRMTFDVL